LRRCAASLARLNPLCRLAEAASRGLMNLI
jgi:hypothetical protein